MFCKYRSESRREWRIKIRDQRFGKYSKPLLEDRQEAIVKHLGFKYVTSFRADKLSVTIDQFSENLQICRFFFISEYEITRSWPHWKETQSTRYLIVVSQRVNNNYNVQLLDKYSVRMC